MDKIANISLGYMMIIFMDTYPTYSLFKINPFDVPKMAFMTNNFNYLYEVMSFGLKKSDATYQRLMDQVFINQIRVNLEVYLDDMVVKTPNEKNHCKDLKDIY